MMKQLLYRCYAIQKRSTRAIIKWLILKIDGGEFYSKTLRRIYKDYHGVSVGMYTHGSVFSTLCADPDTTIGRYCSFAKGVRIVNHDHPVRFKSTHGFFFNTQLGKSDVDLRDNKPIVIGNDVWIGHNAVILPHVESIGDGAVVAAGAVVNKNIPPYAIMAGNPARLIRYRFSKEVIDRLLEERWWDKSIDELAGTIKSEFQSDLEPGTGN